MRTPTKEGLVVICKGLQHAENTDSVSAIAHLERLHGTDVADLGTRTGMEGTSMELGGPGAASSSHQEPGDAPREPSYSSSLSNEGRLD